MRQIVLDTETTGIGTEDGHRIIEIGCVELDNRRLTGRVFHQYVQPDREIDAGAQEVHGISAEFLADKPRFEEIAADFAAFIQGAQLVIHNAAFDVGFMDAEFARIKGHPTTADLCGKALDTLALAREKRPGQRNNLDVLCRAYGVDNSNRELHGALLDAQLLAEVYLAMTREQNSLLAGSGTQRAQAPQAEAKRPVAARVGAVVEPSPEEQAAWQALLSTFRQGDESLPWDAHR